MKDFGTVNVEFFAQVKARIHLTAEELDLLLRYSSAHYDERCQLASSEVDHYRTRVVNIRTPLPGLLIGWQRLLDPKWFDPDEKPTVQVVFGDLDTCLKILECSPPNISPKDQIIRYRLIGRFTQICNRMSRLYTQWNSTEVLP